MSGVLPSVAEAKRQARELRSALQGQGRQISHSQALELTAQRHGFRDWNGFCAAAGDRPPAAWAAGGRVEGTYLSQPFRARVASADQVEPGWFRLVLALDEPVDVVQFASFSNLRRRITAVVGPEGHTRERTSDGAPQLSLKI